VLEESLMDITKTRLDSAPHFCVLLVAALGGQSPTDEAFLVSGINELPALFTSRPAALAESNRQLET
jgi:hypothetical protein